MKAGLFVNQGNHGDFNRWDARSAWDRAIAVAWLAERHGFAALWVPDHVANMPGLEEPGGDFTLDAFVLLSAVALATTRPTVGHLVLCSPFRNPALVAKAISTVDVASGGRAVCGVGAGWNRREFDAYGVPFPAVGERLAILREHLEVLSRMFGPGPASFAGERVRVENAPNEPKSADPGRRVPILVGGNGPNVTWRLAAQFADELNLDYLTADQVAVALPILRSRCEEIDRDPDSLAVSVLGNFPDSRSGRIETLSRYRELGLVRVDRIDRRYAASDEPLLEYVDELHAAGVELATDELAQ